MARSKSKAELPVFEFSRLSSASFFYSAIARPLRLLCHTKTTTSSLASTPFPTEVDHKSAKILDGIQPALTFIYGSESSNKVFFKICQKHSAPGEPLCRSHLVLSAQSPKVVSDFYAAALLAYPESLIVIGSRHSLESNRATAVGAVIAGAPFNLGGFCARVSDFDGNIMEVVCLPTYNDYPAHHGRSSRPRHHSKSVPNYDKYDADNRVLYYSHAYDDSKFKAFGRPTENGSQYTEMPSSYDYRHHRPDRSLTESRPSAVSVHTPTLSRGTGSTSSGFYEDPSTSRYAPHGEYRGMGAAGMFGIAAAGAVAGAALTYSVMRSNSQSRSRSSRAYEYDDAEYMPSFQRRSTFPEPHQSYASSRYDGEAMLEYPQKEVREIEHIREFDGRSRFSPSRQKSGGFANDSRTRARSEQAYDRAPLMIAEGSYHSSRNGSPGQPLPARSSSRHGSVSKFYAEPTERTDRESYVSGARSHRTARGSGAGGSGLPSIPPNASRSASLRHSGGRPGSYMSARNVPLPSSGAGSSHTRWEEDDRYDDDKRFQYDDWDNDSVAPSDSISCVGSRGPSRRYHR